jgi:hypothetical protein
MAKFIKLDLHETDVEVSFEVSEQYVKQWCDSIDVIDTHIVTDEEIAEFDAVVDTIYDTLTHEQKKALFAEALEVFNETQKFNPDTGYCYEVSARKHLSMCVMCSFNDYYVEVTA